METVNLEVKLEHDNPVDLIDMANSLISLSKLTTERISTEHGLADAKIMLTGVKEGSDIYQLALSFGVGVLPLIEGANTLGAFADYIDKFLNLNNQKIKEIEKDETLNERNSNLVSDIITPILSDDTSNYTIGIQNSENAIVNVININNDKAHKILEGINLVKKIKTESKKEENNTQYKKVLISMYATTNSKKKVRDKAYCDDVIQNKAIATVIEDKKDKKSILDDPYNNYFLVDLEVNRIGGEPKLYRVTKLHEVIPKED